MVGLPYLSMVGGKMCRLVRPKTSRVDPNDATTRAAHGNHRHPKRFRFILFDLHPKRFRFGVFFSCFVKQIYPICSNIGMVYDNIYAIFTKKFFIKRLKCMWKMVKNSIWWSLSRPRVQLVDIHRILSWSDFTNGNGVIGIFLVDYSKTSTLGTSCSYNLL